MPSKRACCDRQHTPYQYPGNTLSKNAIKISINTPSHMRACRYHRQVTAELSIHTLSIPGQHTFLKNSIKISINTPSHMLSKQASCDCRQVTAELPTHNTFKTFYQYTLPIHSINTFSSTSSNMPYHTPYMHPNAHPITCLLSAGCQLQLPPPQPRRQANDTYQPPTYGTLKTGAKV